MQSNAPSGCRTFRRTLQMLNGCCHNYMEYVRSPIQRMTCPGGPGIGRPNKYAVKHGASKRAPVAMTTGFISIPKSMMPKLAPQIAKLPRRIQVATLSEICRNKCRLYSQQKP